MSKEADMFRRPSVLIETPAKCITHTDVLPCPLVSNHIRWQDKIPDLEFVERARIPSIHTLPKKPHVRWQCHVTRMPDSRLPKQLLYRALSWWAEVLSWGTEKMFQRLHKEALKDLDINPSSWESLAQDCPAWCSKVTTRANAAKYQQTTEPQRKSATHKGRATSTSTAAPTHSCPMCG